MINFINEKHIKQVFTGVYELPVPNFPGYTVRATENWFLLYRGVDSRFWSRCTVLMRDNEDPFIERESKPFVPSVLRNSALEMITIIQEHAKKDKMYCRLCNTQTSRSYHKGFAPRDWEDGLCSDCIRNTQNEMDVRGLYCGTLFESYKPQSNPEFLLHQGVEDIILEAWKGRQLDAQIDASESWWDNE